MSLSCPYCNHAFEAESPRACPRCGEAIAGKDPPPGINPIMSRDMAAVIELGARIRRRVKQGLVASLVIILIVVAIAFWKLSNEKPSNPVSPNWLPPSGYSTPPLELRGLGYLPSNCNFIFAVQPGPLLVYAEKTKQDPVELLTKNRVPASALGALAQAGITLQQIDHVVGGFHIPDLNEEPRICLVLVLRAPLADEARFLEQLNAKRNGNRFEVKFDNLPMKLDRVSPTTWVFGFTDKDLASGTGGSELPPSFRAMLVERIANDSAVWIAADSARWSEKPILKLLKKEWLPTLAKGRAATVSYSFGEQPKLRVSVQCADAASGEQLRSFFRSKATGERSSASGQGDWATLELAADPTDIFTRVKGFLDEAGR